MSDEPRDLRAHIDDVLARRAAAGPRPLNRDSGHCGRAGCRCTHTGGCDHGWLALPDWTNPQTGITYEQVEPCPVCRPDAADRRAQQLRGESRNAP